MNVGGIVLCGGWSSRMGRPKAWLPVGDEPMLSRVVRILREVVGPVIVVAAPGQDVPPLPAEVAIVRDDVKGLGPLAGLAAGLTALAGRVDAVYLSACDVPLLQPTFVRYMAESLHDDAIAVPHIGGYYHPLAAVYRLSVLPVVRDQLAATNLRMQSLFDLVPTRVISAQDLAAIDPETRFLHNINTPLEYADVLRILGVSLPEFRL